MTEERKGEPADTEFRDWFGKRIKAIRPVAQIVIEADRENLPMIMIYTESGKVAVVPPDVVIPLMNAGIANGLHREVSAVPGTYAAVLITEAWSVTNRTEEESRKYPRNEDNPRREEKLILNALHGNQQLMAFFSIDRKARKLGEAEIVDPMVSGTVGNMVFNKPIEH